METLGAPIDARDVVTLERDDVLVSSVAGKGEREIVGQHQHRAAVVHERSHISLLQYATLWAQFSA